MGSWGPPLELCQPHFMQSDAFPSEDTSARVLELMQRAVQGGWAGNLALPPPGRSRNILQLGHLNNKVTDPGYRLRDP